MSSKLTQQQKLHYVAYGFVRRLENKLKSNLIVPTSIIRLCYAFYRNIESFLFLCQQNKLSIANITSKECYDYEMRSVNMVKKPGLNVESVKSIQPSQIPFFRRNGYGRCLISNMNLSKSFSKCSDSSFACDIKYCNVLVRVGGYNEIGAGKKVDCIVFNNSPSTRAYHIQMDDLERETQHSSLIHDTAAYGDIFVVGGRNCSSIRKLSLLNDFGSMYTFEKKLDENIEGTSLCILENKLFVFGGYQTGGSLHGYTNECCYFEISKDRKELSKAVQIKGLSSNTAYAACTALDNDRIALVGGANSHSCDMEIYNVTANTWIPGPKTKARHTYYCSLWKDPNVHSILYIAGDYLGGSNDNRRSFGAVERIDLREHSAKWSVVWDEKTMANVFFGDCTKLQTRALFTL